MRWWWWRNCFLWLVLSVMTGGPCHRRKKMMGRGPDGGYGIDERTCRSINNRVPASIPSETTQCSLVKEHLTPQGVDFFSQARKTLSELSPFDIPEDASGPVSAHLGVSTLPTGLACLLKQSDSRKRHKRSHSAADKKSSSSRQSKGGSSIWVETEEYFRDLLLPDIDALVELSSSFRSLVDNKSLLIPYPVNGHTKTEETAQANSEVDSITVDKNSNVNCLHVDGYVKKNVVSLEDGTKEKDGQLLEIAEVGAQSEDCLPHVEGKLSSVSEWSGGLEWLLGCRTRMILTSERPSKKRKLLGSDAGLDKILVGTPCLGNSSFCDYCCKTGEDSSPLVVCSSCKVVVHRKCYGVLGDVDESWVCSWCQHKTDEVDSGKAPCVLCQKHGGALKPVAANDGCIQEFAHLFCSLWMPEVYIEDLAKMEPAMNIGGIKDARRELMCNVCKVKGGACVRCSHGACRTAFHPICAREARHRVEVWGKYGSANVELRAFCSKHSQITNDGNTRLLGEPLKGVSTCHSVATAISETSSLNKHDKQLKLNVGRNGDNIAVHVDTCDATSDEAVNGELWETRLSGRSDNENANPSDSPSMTLILKKLIERGKVDVKDLALEIGISPDLLLSTLAEDTLAPGLHCKIIKWLSDHAYMGVYHKNLRVKLNSSVLSKPGVGTADHSGGVTTLSECDVTDPVAVQSVLPRRRTKSNLSLLSDNNVICSTDRSLNDKGKAVDKDNADQLVDEDVERSSKLTIFAGNEKNPDEFQEPLVPPLPMSEGSLDDPSNEKVSAEVELAHATVLKRNNSIKEDKHNPVSADVNAILPDLVKLESCSSFYVHPYIGSKLSEMQSSSPLEDRIHAFEGLREGDSCLETSLDASVCCNHQDKHPKCKNSICSYAEVNSGKWVDAKKLDLFKLSPADELEGELIYFQDKLLGSAVLRKCFTENLIGNIARSLPQEVDTARVQRWDAVLANRYLCDLKEAKKQGRKEKRHKEAQAVLAAATAAAAASSRISSFRKDAFHDSAQQEKYNVSNGRSGIPSQLIIRPKETALRVALPRSSTEKSSDTVQSASHFSKEHPRACDICRRSETMLNPILVCSSCKVAIHLDCYRSFKESTGPWYCELCEELSLSKCSGSASANFWEKPYFVAECGLCGGTTGAFRKATDGSWVHAFCAEWVFEPSFRRGQVNPVEITESLSKGVDTCCICRRRHGVCITCSYGHCQTVFHPNCARSTGFYMNVKTLNGKLQHKAYCEKHSVEQRAKVETQRHGTEELKSIKLVRVELERLRLLCERIIKREKIKRDLVICSHDILACKRDQVARSALVHSSFFPPEVSSESATTSLKGNTDGYKSCGDPIQRSDDVTVDSTASVKHGVNVTSTMDTEQRTDDSSTSLNIYTQKPAERVRFGGKQIPQRPSLASRNTLEDEEFCSKPRKCFETFEKELVMTSDQASMKNQQLPKGYFYVPVDRLPKEKQMNEDASPGGESLENNG